MTARVIGVGVRTGKATAAAKGFAGQFTDALVAIGRAVIGVGDPGSAGTVGVVAPERPVQAIIAYKDRARTPARIHGLEQVAVGIVGRGRLAAIGIGLARFAPQRIVDGGGRGAPVGCDRREELSSSIIGLDRRRVQGAFWIM